ncbi:MAG: type II toxin-antitoxin system HicB family antitoxin [Chloroflexi bacterium]|nr:type II toxin-antitoxin system HicB family antitoxin [Chloroflexota bacterium]
MTQRYLIVLEKAEKNYSAYSPDLPGCIATGDTADEVKQNMREAIETHIRGLIEDDLPIPEPQAISDYVSVAA